MNDLKNTPPQTQLKILLIGDSCTDRYNIGTVDRLSPEAPVPVIKITDSYDLSGMAANVYDNLINLNCWIAFITNRENITKTRYIDSRSGQHLIRVDDEPEIEPWDEYIGEYPWETYDAVVISDYNKGFLTYEHIEHIIQNFKGPIFIDTKKTDLRRFQGAYVKINSLENSLATSTPDDLIVTLGKQGAKYKNKIYPAPTIEVSDVCGAGDTFLAALVLEFLNTQDIKKAIDFANRAAAITVQHSGVYALTEQDITDIYASISNRP
jgi:D-beta-D-heptose 7-phosphate kinase/D-beta-D-heptose 1-phosphate adenosyltransferase